MQIKHFVCLSSFDGRISMSNRTHTKAQKLRKTFSPSGEFNHKIIEFMKNLPGQIFHRALKAHRL